MLNSDPIVLRHNDPDRALAGVRLVQEIGLAAEQVEFGYDDEQRAWLLRLPDVPVWRLEYQLELRHGAGGTELICDPDNPLRAPGGYGEKSVIERPGYRRPEWLARPDEPGEWRELTVSSRALMADLPVQLWTPAGARGILLAHDGGEFDKFVDLGHHSATMIAAGLMPPHHVVLLSPLARNDWYSANPAYAKALADDVLPAVRAESGAVGPVIALGASLGALAVLHAHRRHPRLFGGMFLQSGSFFQRRFDAQESGFGPFARITRFVGSVRRRQLTGRRIPTVLTCGIVEENLANNRAMAQTLREQGYPVQFVEVPDAHNFVAWRDAWDPHLAELARRVWTHDPGASEDG